MFKRKNKRQNNKPKKVVKKRKKVRRKVKTGGRGFAKQYPSIAALKIPEIVPSAVLTEFNQDTQSQSGVVQTVGNGFPVIVLDEETLEVSHLSPKVKTQDLGQLSASIHKDIISSATLAADKANGQLVMIPNAKTLAALDEFDQLRNGNKYQWGVFPKNTSDDNLDAKIELLTNKVSLSQLKNLADNHTSLQVVNNEMVTGNQAKSMSSTNNSTDEVTENQAPNPAQDDTLSDVNPDNLFADDGTQNESQTVETTNNQSTESSESQQKPVAPTPEPAPQSQASTDNPVEPDIDANMLSQAIATGDNSMWDKVFDDDNKPVEPVDDQSYQNKVTQLSNQQLHDNDLNLTVNTDEFTQMLNRTQPLSITGQTSQAPVTDVLKDAVNTLTQEANHKLQQLHESNVNKLNLEYNSRIRQAVASIGNQLQMQGDTPLGRTKHKIDEQYHHSMDTLDELTAEATKGLDDEYQAQKAQAVEAARQAAAVTFDNMHRRELLNQKAQVKQDVITKVSDKHVIALNELQAKRRDVANNTFRDVNSDVLDQMNALNKVMTADEKALADDYMAQLNALVTSRYDQDTQRQRDLANIDSHDTTIQRLNEEKAQLREQNREEIDKVQRSMQQSLVDYQAKASADKRELMDQYDAKLRAKDADVSTAHSRIDELNASFDSKSKQYESQLDDKDTKYQKLLDKSADDLDKAELRREKDLARSHKNTLTTSALGILVAGLVGCLVGFGVFGNHGATTTTTQQPSSGVNVITANPSSQSSSQQSSSSSESSSASSQTHKTEKATETHHKVTKHRSKSDD